MNGIKNRQLKDSVLLGIFYSLNSLGRRIFRAIEFFIALLLALICRFKYGDSITLFGFYGGIDHVNLGDEAICNAMLLRLRQLGHPVWLVNTECRSDYVGVERVFCLSHLSGHWVRWIKVICGTRVLVLGGGGLFQDYGTSQGVPRGLAMVQLLFWIAGRPCVWYSVGVGPLKTAQGRFFTMIAAMLSSKLTVRDPLSAEILKTNLKIHREVLVTTDAAWDLQNEKIVSLPDLSEVQKNHAIIIGMSGFGFYDVVYRDKRHNSSLISAYSDLIAVCLSREYEVKLFCFDNQQDWSFWSEVVAGQLTIHEKQIEIIRTTNLNDMLRTMHTVDALISMRFHSVVLGAMIGIPLGIIAYHPKVQSLAERMQLEEVTLPLSNVSGEKLVKLLDYILNNRQFLTLKELSFSSQQQQLLAINSQLVEDAYSSFRKYFLGGY
jgi:polysaccharide pyruvyl transferase WcaK-like protein